MLLCGIGSLLEGPFGQSCGRFGQGMVPGFTVFQQIIAKGQTFGSQKLIEFKESCLRSGIQSGSMAFKGLEALGQEHAVFGRSVCGQAHRRKASEEGLVGEQRITQGREFGLNLARQSLKFFGRRSTQSIKQQRSLGIQILGHALNSHDGISKSGLLF